MKRNIAIISEHASPLPGARGVDAGGQNVYVRQIAQHLARLGHNVDVFTRRDSQDVPEVTLWKDGVRVVHVPAGPAAYVRKEDLLPHMAEFSAWVVDFAAGQPEPYDLVHANFWMSGLTACALQDELGIPFCITFHALGKVRRFYQGESDEFPDERFAIEELIVQKANAIIAECPQDQGDLFSFYNADPARTTIVPCGVETSEFYPVDKAIAKQALGFSPEQRLILQLGRIVPRKGIDNVIRGFGILRRKYGIDARLLVAGGDDYDPDERVRAEVARLRAIAFEACIQDSVSFLGYQDVEHLRGLYCAADIFVTTPRYEPFGITPLEAMACGTPVIGANVGGIKFSVREGKTGFLVEPNDPDALAERMHRLYDQADLRAQLAHNAVRHVSDGFTWQCIALSLSQVYEDVIRQSQPVALSADAEIIDHGFASGIEALTRTRSQLSPAIIQAGHVLVEALERGNKLLVCGNGGSAADSQHFVAELTGRFVLPGRRALGAIALTTDSTFITAWSNDVSFEEVFSRQVEAIGRPGDVLVAFSTSGRSKNVLKAIEASRQRGIYTLALTGGTGGEMRELADMSIIVPATDTQRIQEVHSLIIHLLCELIEAHVGYENPAQAKVLKYQVFEELAQPANLAS